jgi:hypothetical protein
VSGRPALAGIVARRGYTVHEAADAREARAQVLRGGIAAALAGSMSASG